MRCVVGLVCVLTFMAPPLAVSAQTQEGATSVEPSVDDAELRVKRARIGLISTAAATAVGGAFVALGVAHRDCGLLRSGADWCVPVGTTGTVLLVGGAAGVITTGILLGVRKRKLRRLEHTRYEAPRRAQWNLAGSRLEWGYP